MNMEDKTNRHQAFAGFGVGDFNRLNPDMADNLLHNLPGMVYRCLNDESWTMLFVSGGCEILTGYHPQELLYGEKLTYEEIILPEDRALVRETINQGLKRKTHYQLNYRIKHKDGSIRWMWEQGIGVRGSESETLYLDGVIMDVSLAINLEERLEESIVQLEQLNLMKDKFLNFVLHDLQDPIFSFISLSDFLSQNFESFTKEQILDFLAQIKDSSQRMNLMLGNISNWAKMQKQIGNLPMGLIRLDLLLLEIKQKFKPLLENKKLSLNVEVTPNKVIKSEINALHLLIGTLLSNAIKYSHSGSEISLRFKINEDMLEISVSDNGVGIPSSKIKDLFSTKNDYIRSGTFNENGSGLGLILAKSTLDSLGGTIEVTSKVSKGSKFTIHLPTHIWQ